MELTGILINAKEAKNLLKTERLANYSQSEGLGMKSYKDIETITDIDDSREFYGEGRYYTALIQVEGGNVK